MARAAGAGRTLQRPRLCGTVQLAWRPEREEVGGPPECTVVLASGQLLHGRAGRQLLPLERLPAEAAWRATAADWSAGGDLLAVASGAAVTVWHMPSGQHFSADVSLPVGNPPPP